MDEISSPRDAERLAARIMTDLGYEAVNLTPPGSDGGIDVRSPTGVAQVKLHMKPTGRPDLQRLYGARGSHVEQEMLFFCFMGYSAKAIEYANQVGMALFRYRLDGSYDAVNPAASRFIDRGREVLSANASARVDVSQVPRLRPRREYSARDWALLIILCWPLALLIFCIRNPQQAARFARRVRDFVVQYPKFTVAVVMAVGIGVSVGNTVNGKYSQAMVGVVLAVASVGAMIGLVIREQLTRSADHSRLGVSGYGHVPRFPWSRDHGL